MEGIQSCTPACRGATNAAPVQFQGEAARLTYLNVSEDKSADISIFTAEGDKVSLSSDFHSEATLLTYEHLAYSNSGWEAEQGELVDYNEEQAIALSVKGFLSEQEMADIQALLADLGEMLKSFLTGGGTGEGDIEEASADLGRYSSLSGFEADFEYSAEMQVLNLAADHLAVAAAGSPKLPESMAVSPEPVQPQAAAAAPAAASAAADPTPKTAAQQAAPLAVETPKSVAAQDVQAAREMAKKVKGSGLQPRRFMTLLKKFLHGLMQEMRAGKAVDGEQAKRGETILEKFFSQLEQASGVSEVKATKASLKQQWVSLQYEMKAEVKTPPSVEETA